MDVCKATEIKFKHHSPIFHLFQASPDEESVSISQRYRSTLHCLRRRMSIVSSTRYRTTGKYQFSTPQHRAKNQSCIPFPLFVIFHVSKSAEDLSLWTARPT